MHSEILKEIDIDDLVYGFSSIEIEEFKNLDEVQLAHLSFMVSVNNLSTDNRDRVISCIASAIGVNEVYGLYSNMSKLMTVEGTVAAAKLIIRIYVGWIGVGLAVYSFGDCMGYY